MARETVMTAGEIEKLAGIFVALGVTKIRLTGGEPTLRRDLIPLVTQIANLPGLETLAMTTNGLTLRRQASLLREAGLDGLTISLDTLRRDRFLNITKRDRFDDVWAGIEAALDAGFTPLKLNVVAMRGVNDDELLDFVALIRDRPIHVRFIEYMPFHGTGWNEADLLPYNEMMDRISAAHDLIALPSAIGAVGKDYAIPGHVGAIGFVTSMSKSFCSTCNRLRLTADGQLKSCLFSAAEIDLLSALRTGASDTDLEDLLHMALARKPEAHPPMAELLSLGNRAMIEIGG